ncbi:MAG: hypothetical protein DHS20C18_20520 [Saprospiraceae bacterium]|nr:MAG: hypothetical protein DHS20C18_20520 [Saprospiraceae bacterium]
MDVSSWDFSQDGRLKLIGEWAFYPDQLLTGAAVALAPKAFVQIPIGNDNEQVPATTGCITYRLQLKGVPQTKLLLSVKHIETAYRLIINGEVIQENGQVSCQAITARPDYSSRLIYFENHQDELELILQVSNFHARALAVPTAITIGLPEAMIVAENGNIAFDSILFGALIIIAFYHFIIYLVRRKDASLLYFAVVSLAMGIRTLLSGERLLYTLFGPDFWPILFKIDYLTYPIGSLFFFWYIHAIFPREYPRWQLLTIAVPAIVYAIVIMASPSIFYTQGLIYYHLVTAVGLIYIASGLALILGRKRTYSLLFVAGFLALILGVTNDLLYTNGILISGFENLSMIGVFIFFVANSAFLAARFSRAYQRVADLSHELQKVVNNQVQLNQAIKRFVPVQFLQELGKEDYAEIQMGDSTAKVMSVLFSDLRSFTKMAERLSPQVNFQFLNSYFKKMEPYIEQHGGFIDKYIGDAIMALFRDRPEDRSADAAVKTALALRVALKDFNQQRTKQKLETIEFGIGINTGELMLGTVGSENRLDTTVIGDTVNLASRLEALTKYFKTPILLSDFTYRALSNPFDFNLRRIDIVRVPGKEKTSVIYELISPEDPEVADRKMGSLLNFYLGMDLYAQRRFGEALKIYEQICEYNPGDTVAAIYKKRCQDNILHPPPPGWSRVMEIRYK